MADKPSEPPSIPLIENPFAPEIFVDGVAGFYLVGNTLRVTLESVRANYSKAGAPPTRVVVGRIILPIDRAEDLAKNILNLVNQHKAAAAGGVQEPKTVN